MKSAYDVVPGGQPPARVAEPPRGGGRAGAGPRPRARQGLRARDARARRTSAPAASPRPSEEFERAVEIEPVNDYAHFGLGLCLMRQGDRIGARRHLKLAVAMRPDQRDYRAALERALDEPT